MTRQRSIGWIAIATLTACATAAVCFAEAIGLVAAHSDAIGPPPYGSSTRPIEELQMAEPWLTAVPGGVQSLEGKVVVVNFWTYSCINSLRALPYLRAWAQRYGTSGLVVVGVHTPEFQFEHDVANVELAIKQLAVTYPNLQDNDSSVWRSFGNEGWPGFYFIDAQGRVRGYLVGEGRYAEAEQLIRTLLTEAGHAPPGISTSPTRGGGIEAEADWSNLGSPESYIGYARATNFLSPEQMRQDKAALYSQATSLPLSGWDLAGQWVIGPEYATLTGSGGSLRYRFHARDAHMVLGGPSDGRPVRFRVTIDGAVPGPNHGADIDAEGWGEIREDRLYQLVRETKSVRDRTIAVEFERSGVRAYSLTFG